ncbi:hypothetical protein D3C81_2073800 [compost metagenome]
MLCRERELLSFYECSHHLSLPNHSQQEPSDVIVGAVKRQHLFDVFGKVVVSESLHR